MITIDYDTGGSSDGFPSDDGASRPDNRFDAAIEPTPADSPITTSEIPDADSSVVLFDRSIRVLREVDR